MKYIHKNFILTIFMFMMAWNLKAQFKSAEKYYDNYSFQNAIKGYSKIVKKDNTNGDALFNLANAYRLNSKTIEAEIWFEKAVVYYDDPICKLYYAQVLLSNAKYLKAKTWFLKFVDDAPTQNDAEIATEMANFCQQLNDNGMPEHIYSIREVPFNTKKYDYSPCFYKDSAIVFVSNRDYKDVDKKKDKWTGDNYMKLFIARKNANGTFQEPEKFINSINSKFHEGPACFSSDFNTMYFTKNQANKQKSIVDENQNTLLGIYSANYIDNKWDNLQKLPFCNDNYTVCHPTTAKSDSFMIFVSDIPGGYGGTDLYIVYQQNGQWANPENLGDKINTVGNEVFPYLDVDNNLYYSSDMLIGFGGLDIFKSFYKNSKWGEPENLGVPLNSSKDDFGLVINNSFAVGYFTSNRAGEDNIYTFTENFEIILKQGDYTTNENRIITKENVPSLNTEPKKTTNNNNPNKKSIEICGTVTNKKYGNLLKDANVEVVSKCTGDETVIVTKQDGAFTFDIEPNCDYKIKVSKKNFNDTTFLLSTFNPKYDECIKVIVPLIFIEENIPDPLTTDITIVDGMTIELYNVYFDFDKYNIRTDASQDLDVLYNLLIKYPNMKGELGAHTDSRGTHEYNVKLAQNRANSAMKYLINKGIDPARLTAKGYGETMLKNKCADGVECSETEHQRNRRIEFKVNYKNEIIYSKEYEKYKQ